MKKVLFLIVLILFIGFYIAGYWPQHEQVTQLQHDNAYLHQQVSAAQSAAYMCQLENEMLNLLDQAKAQNYGNAQKLAGQFFNDLQKEISRVPNAPYTPTLQNIQSNRDAVIASLARADASTVATLQQDMNQLVQITQQLTSQVAP